MFLHPYFWNLVFILTNIFSCDLQDHLPACNGNFCLSLSSMAGGITIHTLYFDNLSYVYSAMPWFHGSVSITQTTCSVFISTSIFSFYSAEYRFFSILFFCILLNLHFINHKGSINSCNKFLSIYNYSLALFTDLCFCLCSYLLDHSTGTTDPSDQIFTYK